MLNYCKYKWAENEQKLKEAIEKSENHIEWEYDDLVRMVVTYILNKGGDEEKVYGANWSDNLAIIDDGDYQGTLIYLIHREVYQPSPDDYLITYVDYGSCPGCDTLEGIQSDYDNKEKYPKPGQVMEYMTLCRDIVTHFKHPFDSYIVMEEAEIDD